MICEVGAGLSIIAAVGLDFEAAAARGPGVDVAIGLNRKIYIKTLREKAANGSLGIISFGIAGGLSPGLKPGDTVIATSVMTSRGTYDTCPVSPCRHQGPKSAREKHGFRSMGPHGNFLKSIQYPGVEKSAAKFEAARSAYSIRSVVNCDASINRKGSCHQKETSMRKIQNDNITTGLPPAEAARPPRDEEIAYFFISSFFIPSLAMLSFAMASSFFMASWDMASSFFIASFDMVS